MTDNTPAIGNGLDPVLTQATQAPSPAEEKTATLTQDKGILARISQAEAAGPTTRQRTQSEIIDLALLQGHLGNPFSTRWVPFEQIREMTTDLMLAFGWWMTVNPLIRSEWSIDCPNAKLAAAVDEALRPVITSTILAFSNALWFGHQPLVKQFKLGQLGSTYRDPTATDPEKDLPVWDSSADALLWKPPAALNPSHCLPRWNDNGEMIGFTFSQMPIPHFDLISAASAYGYMVVPGLEIGPDNAMWITNEQELHFGSLFGSGRAKRAYPYWWSYWFRWRLADRSFENLADPAKLVYYPVDFDEFIDPDDPNQESPKIQQARQTAIALGTQARSGATLAMPGSFVESADGKNTGHRKWEIDYLASKNNFSELSTTFRELDIQKLRAWFVPEQAFIEGCLKKTTPILCPRDHKKYPDGIPLCDIEPGQMLWTYNETSKQFHLSPVKRVHPTKIAETFKVTLDNGSEIEGTSNHPFMRRDGSWAELQDLRPGDSLMPLYESTEGWYNASLREDDFEPLVYRKSYARNRKLAPVNHKVVSIVPAERQEVWDIEMDAPPECQNFVAAGVVVHNSGSKTAGGSGGGGGGARMATQLGQVYEESQQLLVSQYDSYVSDHMIPQFIAANFPELIGTPCHKVSRALGVLDDQTRSQLLTLIGQVRGEVLPVDTRELLKQMGAPLLNEDQMRREVAEIAKLSAMQGPPEMEPQKVGTQGYNAGVVKTATGQNMYMQPQQRIVLAESDGFMNNLPDTPHYRDPGVRSAVIRLRRLFLERYKEQYESFAAFLADKSTLHLAQTGSGAQNQGLSKKQAAASAAAIIAGWAAVKAPGAVGHASQVVSAPGSIGEKMADLVAKIALSGGNGALKGARLDADDFGAEVLQPWVQDRVKFALGSIDSTVRDEALGWLTSELQASVDPDTVASAAKQHFEDFAATHTDRVVRSETVEAFNQGTLQALDHAGVVQVQAHDASDGADLKTDALCQTRNGQVFSIPDAMAAPTHPNDTLYWTALSTEKLSLERVTELPEHFAKPGLNVAYDESSETLYLVESAGEDLEQAVLLMLGDQLAL